MRIQKMVPAEPDGGTNRPFLYCGQLICIKETEQDHNLLADFVENCWLRQGGDDYAVAFTPTESAAVLWVSAKTEKQLQDFLSWATDLLVRGFRQKGVNCTFVI